MTFVESQPAVTKTSPQISENLQNQILILMQTKISLQNCYISTES